MALGDGITWDESLPTDNTFATLIDDHILDVRKGVRSRMAWEHEWPASQVSTAAAGYHKFITLQNQSTHPTISGTQVASLYTKTVGAGLQEMFFADEAGNETQVTQRGMVKSNCIGFAAASTTGVILTGIIPYDVSIPQTGEGAQIVALAYAAKTTGSSLVLKGHLGFAATESLHSIWSLFIGTTANAIAAGEGCHAPTNGGGELNPFFIITPTTTGSVTYYFRAGSDVGGLIVNGNSAAGVLFGTKSYAFLTIEELV